MITYSLGLFDQLEGIRGKIKKKPPQLIVRMNV